MRDINSKDVEIIIKSITETLISDGSLSENDLKNKEALLEAVTEFLDKHEVVPVIDHKNHLLQEARKLKNNQEYNISRILYATFFEHHLNYLIHVYCITKNIDQKTQLSIIRSLGIHEKLTWLLILMEFPKFNEKHRSNIKQLADSRNQFVHYKWKVEEDFFKKKTDTDKDISEEFIAIEKAATYIQSYCSKITYKGKKGKIDNIFKSD